MNGMELLLTVAMVAYLIWEIFGIFAAMGKIKVPGKVFGRWISIILVAVLMVIAIYRNRDNMQNYWIVFTAMAAAFILFAFVKSGLGEKGLYFNGHYVPYTRLQTYSVDRESETTVGIRFESKRKDYILEFPKEQRELVVAYMLREKVVPANAKSNTKSPY